MMLSRSVIGTLMASKFQRPAAVAGVSGVLERFFDVPTTPTILKSDAVAQLRQALQERQIEGAQIELSDEPVHRGMLVDASGKRVEFPPGRNFDRAYIALVNLEPAARWAHPALWAFISSEKDTPITFVDTNVPESQKGVVRLLPAGKI